MSGRDLRNPWHWGRVLLMLVAGLVIGGLGAFVQGEAFSLALRWGTVLVPWGIVLVWAAFTSMVRAGAWGSKSRMGSWAVVAGWLVATVSLAAQTASGGLVITSDVRDVVYVVGGVILGAVAAMLPVPHDTPAS